jgi:hypothetical protein
MEVMVAMEDLGEVVDLEVNNLLIFFLYKLLKDLVVVEDQVTHGLLILRIAKAINKLIIILIREVVQEVMELRKK